MTRIDLANSPLGMNTSFDDKTPENVDSSSVQVSNDKATFINQSTNEYTLRPTSLTQRSVLSESPNASMPKPVIDESKDESEDDMRAEAVKALNTLKEALPPLKPGDLMLSDPQFQNPPSKPKTLSSAISTYTTSFQHLINNEQRGPDIDWSERVYKTYNNLFVSGTSVLTSAFGAAILGAAVLFEYWFDGNMPTEPTFAHRLPYHMIMVPAIGTMAYILMIGGFHVSDVSANLLASGVAASVDTYEQLTKEEQAKTPEERFIEKHQRMEQLLQEFKNLRDGKPVEITGVKSLMESVGMRVDWIATTRFGMYKETLKTAIKDIENWLEIAETQKHYLIDNPMVMMEEKTKMPETNDKDGMKVRDRMQEYTPKVFV